jgi:hypothetical protein
MSRFLTGRSGDQLLWTCIDESLCTRAQVASRRFSAYLSPYPTEADARQALLEAGADPDSIQAEQRPRGKRARR